MSRVTIDLTLPAHWQAKAFWTWRKRRAFGLVLAVSGRTLAIGVEAIAGTSKGLAVMIGPCWLGFATLKIGE